MLHVRDHLPRRPSVFSGPSPRVASFSQVLSRGGRTGWELGVDDFFFIVVGFEFLGPELGMDRAVSLRVFPDSFAVRRPDVVVWGILYVNRARQRDRIARPQGSAHSSSRGGGGVNITPW